MQKIKLYTVLFGIATLVTGIGLLVYINLFAPDSAVNVIIFYLLSATFFFFSCTLLTFYLRRRFGQREFLNQYFAIAIREGFWLGLLWVICLVLLNHGLFSWLNAGLLILMFIFFEGYLLTRKSNSSNFK